MSVIQYVDVHKPSLQQDLGTFLLGAGRGGVETLSKDKIVKLFLSFDLRFKSWQKFFNFQYFTIQYTHGK